ncbi:hypothetical protein EP30_07215 [Bifidobacterium sp. UTCIF-39]|uniref:WD40 repeat domain-containing protein n=1 Tax=Bifidobacterium sp. UTCIF-39 TaxID=1465359 RepID=UPI00112C823C|nr:WD40 repeat domain-containing protein [Bifidobacterium sp. UTCIF-39]TPF96524.1 hypothetical protein EP30_07215 [Bifidobacterium sp. UTCIF-39]
MINDKRGIRILIYVMMLMAVILGIAPALPVNASTPPQTQVATQKTLSIHDPSCLSSDSINLTLSPDGKTAYVFTRGSTICAINTEDMSIRHIIHTPADNNSYIRIQSPVFTSDGNTMFTLCSDDAALRIVAIDTRTFEVQDLSSVLGRDTGMFDLSSDGSRLFTIGTDGAGQWQMQEYDIAKRTVIAKHRLEYPHSIGGVKGYAVSPDSSHYFASLDTDPGEINQGKLISINTADGSISDLSFDVASSRPEITEDRKTIYVLSRDKKSIIAVNTIENTASQIYTAPNGEKIDGLELSGQDNALMFTENNSISRVLDTKTDDATYSTRYQHGDFISPDGATIYVTDTFLDQKTHAVKLLVQSVSIDATADQQKSSSVEVFSFPDDNSPQKEFQAMFSSDGSLYLLFTGAGGDGTQPNDYTDPMKSGILLKVHSSMFLESAKSPRISASPQSENGSVRTQGRAAAVAVAVGCCVAIIGCICIAAERYVRKSKSVR